MGKFSKETLDDLRKVHEDMIYPTVRVRTPKAGGSGLVVYSKPVPDSDGKYETYVMTCHHVIAEAIKKVKKKHPFADRYIETEARELVQVEIFEYEEMSSIVGAAAYNAEIMAWDEQYDLALLRLKSSKPFKYVAKLYPKGKSSLIKLGMGTYSCGCSLGHEPILNKGRLMGKHDIIENEEYWLSTANTIFGNSGGSDFLVETHEYVGITARISGYQLGFSVDIITWMGFIIPIETIYRFWDKQIFQFIYDSNFTSKQCEKLREEKRKEEEKKLLLPQENSPIKRIGDAPKEAEDTDKSKYKWQDISS